MCLGLSQAYSPTWLSEDCLFVNVWAPAHATPDSKLPVWFYIQGGGYISNANGNYNGTKVVQESGGNIIFVNFNYRVSAYGFLASEKIRRDGVLNAGLLDQRKALEWVQRYISLVSHFLHDRNFRKRTKYIQKGVFQKWEMIFVALPQMTISSYAISTFPCS